MYLLSTPRPWCISALGVALFVQNIDFNPVSPSVMAWSVSSYFCGLNGHIVGPEMSLGLIPELHKRPRLNGTPSTAIEKPYLSTSATFPTQVAAALRA
ncbi:hypothetical protein BJX61DRAFT_539162 [Aspergillus egyptiacus]|nr:hypothetical protein BJX61DRAFT_539162 [Aspergillus egyptiacus]